MGAGTVFLVLVFVSLLTWLIGWIVTVRRERAANGKKADAPQEGPRPEPKRSPQGIKQSSS